MNQNILRGSACAVALALSAGAADAIELNLGSGLAETHIVETTGNAAFIACVTEKSAGDITFNYFPSGQIVGIREGVEAMEQGLADIAFVSPVNQGARLPLQGLSILPGLGESVVQQTEAFRKVVDGDNPIAKEIRDAKMRALFINILPPYQVMSMREPVDSLDDFAGLKTRAAGSSMILTINELGATPVEMTAGDMYVSLQRGTIDATLLSSVSIAAYKLEELLKSVSRNANFGTSVTFTAISDASWAKLSPAQQAIVTECSAKIEAEQAKYFDQRNTEIFDEVAAKGVTVYDISPELMAEIDARLASVAETYIKRLDDAGVKGGREGYEALLAALGR